MVVGDPENLAHGLHRPATRLADVAHVDVDGGELGAGPTIAGSSDRCACGSQVSHGKQRPGRHGAAWRPVKPISTSRGSPDAGLMMSSEAGSGSAIFGSDGVLGELLDERDHVRGRMNGLAGGVREVPGMHQELKAQNACEHFSRGHAIAEGQLAPKPSFAPGGKTRFHGHCNLVFERSKSRTGWNLGDHGVCCFAELSHTAEQVFGEHDDVVVAARRLTVVLIDIDRAEHLAADGPRGLGRGQVIQFLWACRPWVRSCVAVAGGVLQAVHEVIPAIAMTRCGLGSEPAMRQPDACSTFDRLEVHRHGRAAGRWDPSILAIPTHDLRFGRVSRCCGPPSTSRQTPVRNSASSLAKNMIDLATSSGVARRPMGMPSTTIFSMCSGRSALPIVFRSNPVAADTGATQFTRMSGASSTARPLVSVMTAPFDALYGVSPLRGRRPPIDAVLTIELPGRHVRREVLGRKEHASDIDRPHEVELLGREIDHVATTMRQPGIGGRRCRYHPTQRP
ncbi:hypothetical protein GQR58_030162 [Nymphon striatum]|nr:hypothetical protein GQR58_030162 [Nymphon striatum]